MSPMLARISGVYLAVSTGALALATWLPQLRVHNRWIRMLEFPRPQWALWCLANLAMLAAGAGGPRARPRLGFVLGAAFVTHAWRLFGFTPLKPTESAPAPRGSDPGESVSLLISNVLMDNRDSERLISTIRREKPDLVLLVETDDWWASRLEELDSAYPHSVKVPQSNTYGMMLFSRLPLREVRVDRRIEFWIPSIQAVVDLPCGKSFRLYGVHPRPPAEEDTEYRDAELYLVGKEAKATDLPFIVAGDVNDVAWSRSTRLFQKVSGTLDPRVGRGFFNSFHADYPFLRYSLDHVFHTPHFGVQEMRRLGKVGSDHFPILIRLRLDPARPSGNEPEPPSGDEREHVEETMSEAGAAAA